MDHLLTSQNVDSTVNTACQDQVIPFLATLIVLFKTFSNNDESFWKIAKTGFEV